MVNRFSSLGSALGRQAQQVATPSSAGNALAGAVRRSAPPPPVQRQASTAGQRAFQQAQPAIQQAVNRFAQGAAQPSDEPWVSVVNEDDPADILYMPQSVAENRPSNYLISRVLDPYETQARQNPDNPENIYAQPPEIQAAFGIAMPGLGVSDPKDVRPTDFASFVRQATENLRTDPGIDYLMQGILTTGEEYLSDPAYAIARILGTEPTVPEPQPPVDPTSGMTPVGASPVENRDSIIERAAGAPTGLLPSLRARAESAPVSSGSDNLLDILMGVNIPGLNQTVGEVADVLEEPAQGAQGTITDIFRDITNANPREWFLTEGVPFLQAVQDAIGIDRDEAFRIWEPGDWSASLANLIEEGIGQGIAAIGSASEAIMPETLEDVPGLFLAAINYPAEKTQAWRIDTMMKAITGQELSTEEEQYVRAMVGSEAVSDLTKELPFGIGWGLEKAENIVPMDLEWWIIRNPDKAQAAFEEGGHQGVWEAYQEDTTGEGIGGLTLRFGREVTNDPLTFLPVAGAAGKGVSRIGRGLRMAPDAGIARQVIGEIFEGAGEGVYRTTRGAEMIADLGLEPILDVIARGVNATGITQPTRGAQRQRISDEIHGALDVVQGTQTRVNANQVGPDGQPVGPDAGGPPLVVDDVTRATTDGEPALQTAPDGQPVGPTRGGDGGAPTTAGTPTRAIPEAEVQQTGAGAARLTEDQAAARIDTAQSQPEPPVEGAGAIQVGEAVTYTPEIAIRRVDDGWQVEVSTDGVNVERYTPAPWRDALSDAEITRQNLGIDASRVTTISPRWVPDIARGQRVIDQIVRDMPDATTRSRFMESMADEWNESVDRQATIKRGGTPVVDQAIESSRITHATYQQARQSLPGGWTPRYESGRTPQGVGNPYQAAEDVIHQSWATTAPQRRFLYRNPNHGWGGAAPGISTSDAERIRDSIPQNFSRKSGAEKTRILEQARRYVDLVNEHERWMPDDPSPGWAEAKAKRDAILANPHFQKYQQSKNHLISEGGLPGSRRTQGMRDAERRGRETEAQRQRDAEVDPRYELTEVMDDGTLVYRVDGEHTAYITPERRSDIPAATRDQFRDHPDYENSRWFTGHIERNGQNVTGSRTHPNQAELLDELTAEANITPRTDTPDGDAARAVDAEDPAETVEAEAEAEAATPAEDTPSVRTDESEPAPGTKDFTDEVVAPPETTPAPRATIPPQVRHAPQSMARTMGDTTRRRRPIARSTDFTGTTNEGFLFAEPGGRNAIPLAPEIEELLEGFTFSDGTSLKKRLDDLKWHFMNGKSRMWAGDAETAAINQAVKEVEERLLERFPDRNIPIPLKRFLKVWDGIIQYQRERMLFGWEKAISYPAIQATGNAAIALMNGKASWIPYYTTKGWRDARRKALDAPKKQAALDEFNAKLRKQAARQDRKNKKGPLAEKHDATLLEQRKVIYRRLAEEGDPRPWRRDPGLPAYSKMLADLNLGEGREIRDLTQGIYADLDDDLMVTKLLKKIGTPEHNLGGLGKLTGSKRIARWGTYWDSAWRHTVGLYTMRNKLAEITPDFRNYVKQRMEQWHPDADADAIWNDFWAKNEDGLFSADDLYTHYREAGLTEGQATRLHRDWQSRLNTAHKETRDEIRRITYAGDETNADAVLRRTLVFHYFFSRQAWNFAHQMAKHPFLINAYFELQDELAQYAEEHDGIVPDWMKGWVAMVGAPGGMNLFINPVNLFSTYLMFNQEMDFKPDGITDFGEILRTIDDKVGLAPFLMAGFNLLGYMGDDWAPDPFMLWREARTITTAINFARARGWIGDSVRPIGNIYEDFMSQAREWISGLGLPGSEEIPATSSVNKMHREIHAIAIDEARKMGRDPQFEDGSPTNEDAIWVMAQLEDENSELYKASVKRWTAGELATIAIQDVASPLRPRTRFAMESGEGQEIGAVGSEINPDLMGSVSEMEAYDVTGTTPEAMELIRQKAEYDMIGTDEQQKASRVYNNLVYGDYLYEINLDGTIYTPEDIRAMSLDERKQLAMAFLVDRGVDDDWVAYQDERREFLSREENREFATFDRWADEVRDYDGGILAYWDELISDPDNADARWYYESVLQAGYSRERTEIMLTTPDAYLAAQGITYDPFAPVFQGGGEDPLGIFDGPKRPQADDGYVNEYHEELRNDAPKVAQEMIQWDEAVSRKQAEFGIDPSIPFNDLDYKTRKSIEDALEDEGVKEPDIPHSMKLYLAWVDEQPPGADVSVEAFIEWDSAQYRAGAKDRLAESVAMPEMTNEEALAVIGRLRKEHDHRTYGDSSSSGGGGGR